MSQLEDQLERARVLAADDDSYGWRQKDWDKPHFALNIRPGSSQFRTDLSGLLNRHPELLPRVAAWLDDERRLGEVTVAEVGLALLLNRRPADCTEVCRALADGPPGYRTLVLRRYAADDIEPMFEAIAGWVAPQASPQYPETALACLYSRVSWAGRGLPERFLGILATLRTCGIPAIEDRALIVTLAVAPVSPDLIDQLRQRQFESEVLVPAEYTVLHERWPDLVMSMLANEIRPGTTDQRAINAMRQILHLSTDRRLALTAARLSQSLIDRAAESAGFATAMATAVEALLAPRTSNDPTWIPPPARIAEWTQTRPPEQSHLAS
ncbi:hypothetical protein AB0K00_18045 [Dactylosporangium sp. NPDC049525]|uniref:hypothetical protein n=1 Tax=Dactylosporangium sp. NPDC049525 TaxID=3154730 RepID=UPI00342862C6